MTEPSDGLRKRIVELEKHLAEERERFRAATDELEANRLLAEAARAESEAARGELEVLRRHIQDLTGSTGFRLLDRVRRGIDRVAPWGSRRRGFVLAVSRTGFVALTEGRRGVVLRMRYFSRWRSRFWARSPEISPALPLDQTYQVWLDKHRLTELDKEQMRAESASFSYRPLVSVLMPVHNADPQLLVATVESARSQIYDRWELCAVDSISADAATRAALMKSVYLDERIKVKFLPEGEGTAVAANEALAMSSGEFLVLLHQHDELQPAALFEVVKLLNADPRLDLVYTDEDRLDADGRRVQPFFKPGWSPELLLSMDYMSRGSVYRAELVKGLGGLRAEFEGSEGYDLVLRATEATRRIARIEIPLYSTRKGLGDGGAQASDVDKRVLADAVGRRGYEATILDGAPPGSYRVRYELTARPKVSIIVPTRDYLSVLSRCVDSIRDKTSYDRYEIVIVDNESADEPTLEYLANFDGRVLRCPGQFNYSAINNFTVSQVDGDVVVFLNNDTEVISGEWLEAMLEHCQRPEVGIVGARLLYPDTTVQHEGILVGCTGLAANLDHRDYCGFGRVIRDMSAVTAACMMMRRQTFLEVGGLDEGIPIAFNDVDLCLKTGESGYRVVYTPYALLYHHEGMSRGRVHPLRDEIVFRARWSYQKKYADPFYNSNLDICRPFTLDV